MLNLNLFAVRAELNGEKSGQESKLRFNEHGTFVLLSIILEHRAHLLYHVEPVLNWHLQVQQHKSNWLHDLHFSHYRISELLIDSVDNLLAVDEERTLLDDVHVAQDLPRHLQVQPVIISHEDLSAVGWVWHNLGLH